MQYKLSEIDARRSLGLRTLSELARELGLRRHVLDYAVRFRDCPKPCGTIKGRTGMYYTPAQIEDVRKYFARS